MAESGEHVVTRSQWAWGASVMLALAWAAFLGWPAGRADRGPSGRRAPQTTAPAGVPNVVMVIGCTVRKDQTTPYGGAASTTPFLAQLAREGSRFSDALSTSSWTREAVVGVLTGHHAATVGMVEPGPAHSRRRLPRQVDTLAEHLRRAGWFTIGLTANPNLNRAFGFGQGFVQYGDAPAEGFRREKKVPGRRVVRRALAALDRRPDPSRPFYLQLVLLDPHMPRRTPDEHGVLPSDLDAYRTALRSLDDALGALDEGLQARGLGGSDTLWVFVADHGEGLSLPAHHRIAHGKRMYDTTVAIPWIVRGPGVVAGGVVDGVVSGIDVSATVLGLVGVPGGGAGLDWSRRLRGDAGGPDRSVAYSMSMFLSADVAASWTSERQCQSGYGAFADDPDGIPRGCFDRAADPGFERPFLDGPALGALDRWREARIAEGEGRSAADAEVDPGLRRQLEILGYRDEEAGDGGPR